MAADPLPNRNLALPQAGFHHPARHAQIKPRAISVATGAPGTPRVHDCGVACVEQDAAPILQIAPVAQELRDHNTRPFFAPDHISRPLPKRQRTGTESRQLQAADSAYLNTSMEFRFGKLDAAIAANLLSIPPPGIDPVRCRHGLCGNSCDIVIPPSALVSRLLGRNHSTVGKAPSRNKDSVHSKPCSRHYDPY